MVLAEKHLALEDSLKQDSARIMALKYFVGSWRGKIDNDDLRLMFNADGVFRGRQENGKEEFAGHWKIMGDTLYIEGDEVKEGKIPGTKPEKVYFTYTVKSNDGVLLYLIKEKKEYLFKRLK